MKKASVEEDILKEARALHESGRLLDAAITYKRITEHDPRNEEAYFGWGTVAHERGNYENAIALFQKVLEINPGHVIAQTRIGTALFEQRYFAKAGVCFMKAIEIDDRYVPAYNNLALVHISTGDPWKAEEICRDALKIDDGNAGLYATMGLALHGQGNTKAAIRSFEKALKLEPENIETMANLGSVYMDIADTEKARHYFEKALKKDPDYADAHYALTNVRSYRKNDAHIRKMEQVLEKRAAEEERATLGRIRLHFALGRAYEKAGDVDHSFSHYARGNYLARSTMRYSREATERSTARIKKVFKGKFEQHALEIRKDDPVPIFIVGMPRSGTTLTEQILHAHPDVSACGELPYMNKARHVCGFSRPAEYKDDVRNIPVEKLEAARDDYFYNVSWHAAKGARYFTDKMPINFQYVGLIRLLFPQAKIIHCRRDPMDSCFSIYKCLFAGDFPFAYDLEDLGHYYKLYEEIMAFWHKKLPGFVHDVQYEDMVADQEGVTRGILDFCGLEWNDACLDFHSGERAVMTASALQVKKPLYKSGIGRWKKYANHLILLEKALE